MKKHTSHSVTEIFEHLITVLKAKGKTLLEVFDIDQSGFIDVDEFNERLQSMGFTITQE